MAGCVYPSTCCYWSNKVGHEESLILFKNHSILNGLLLIEIIPCAISTLLAVAAIFKNPITILILYCWLHLWNKLVIYSDIAVGWTSDDQFLLAILANSKIKMKLIFECCNKVLWDVLTQRPGSQDCRVGISSVLTYMEYGLGLHYLMIHLDYWLNKKQHKTRQC